MNTHDLKYCPGTLSEGFNTYSPDCLHSLFDGKHVSHILPYGALHRNEKTAELFLENRKRIYVGSAGKVELFVEE